MPRPPFALLQREWYVAARRIKVLRPSTESLIGAVIPLSLEGNLLTLELPESQLWLYEAEGPQRQDVEMALAQLFGCSWRVRFVRSQDMAETHGGEAKSQDGPPASSTRRFEPAWHPVPDDLERSLTSAGFRIVDREDGRIVQAGYDQPDDLIRLRTTAKGVNEAQAVANSTVGMSVGYKWTAPRIPRRIDRALSDPNLSPYSAWLVDQLKGARGALARARRRTWPSEEEDRRSGGWRVQGGLPSLGKRR